MADISIRPVDFVLTMYPLVTNNVTLLNFCICVRPLMFRLEYNNIIVHTWSKATWKMFSLCVINLFVPQDR